MIALKNSNLEIDKKLISKLFGISDVTITKTYKKILEYEYIIINNKMTETILTMSTNDLSKSKMEHKNLCNQYNVKYLEFISMLYRFNEYMNKIKLYHNLTVPCATIKSLVV